ncbi:hypothetical protein PR002_g25681 [Phytophthora rubi]|uniref:Uncharacterized protein n=1 Tax=Phytophthora rubi TaxID=129364 RepID=A0A6A3HX31_9STRA|nr:hypothetical protein PR002_g25681 [Phytophthora rubi]
MLALSSSTSRLASAVRAPKRLTVLLPLLWDVPRSLASLNHFSSITTSLGFTRHGIDHLLVPAGD